MRGVRYGVMGGLGDAVSRIDHYGEASVEQSRRVEVANG